MNDTSAMIMHKCIDVQKDGDVINLKKSTVGFPRMFDQQNEGRTKVNPLVKVIIERLKHVKYL